MTADDEKHEEPKKRGAESTVKGVEPTLPSESGAPQPINPETGQHAAHWVLPKEEREKGFIRPLRTKYVHEKCGSETIMPHACAETYARQPGFYGKTFCCACRGYFPVGEHGEFSWLDDGTKVGT
jgi:hypothetical protein